MSMRKPTNVTSRVGRINIHRPQGSTKTSTYTLSTPSIEKVFQSVTNGGSEPVRSTPVNTLDVTIDENDQNHQILLSLSSRTLADNSRRPCILTFFMSVLLQLQKKIQDLKEQQKSTPSTSTDTAVDQLIDEYTALIAGQDARKSYGIKWSKDVEEAEAQRAVERAKALVEEENSNETSTNWSMLLANSLVGETFAPLVLALVRVLGSLLRVELGALLIAGAISIALSVPFTKCLLPAHMVSLAVVLITL
jgi:hypothetical protein